MELSRAQAIIELQELGTECRELKRMLFELSCDIQRDVTTVDFEHLGSVMLRLRKAEAEKSTLLEMHIAAFNFQESAQGRWLRACFGLMPSEPTCHIGLEQVVKLQV